MARLKITTHSIEIRVVHYLNSRLTRKTAATLISRHAGLIQTPWHVIAFLYSRMTAESPATGPGQVTVIIQFSWRNTPLDTSLAGIWRATLTQSPARVTYVSITVTMTTREEPKTYNRWKAGQEENEFKNVYKHHKTSLLGNKIPFQELLLRDFKTSGKHSLVVAFRVPRLENYQDFLIISIRQINQNHFICLIIH